MARRAARGRGSALQRRAVGSDRLRSRRRGSPFALRLEGDAKVVLGRRPGERGAVAGQRRERGAEGRDVLAAVRRIGAGGGRVRAGEKLDPDAVVAERRRQRSG